MKGRIFAVFLFFIIGWNAFSQSGFESTVQTLLERPEYKNASVGINVLDLSSAKTIFEWNPEKLLIPASTMKLVTTAGALEILGSNYRFQTKIAYFGKIDNNQTLNGNLVVIGGGDPTLGSEYFRDHYSSTHFLELWVQQIKTAGIRKINGDLVLDGSIYDSEKVPDTWIWGDIGNYYGAGPSAFTVYDNLFRITFRSPQNAGEPTEIISTYPKIEGLEITNEVLSSEDKTDQAYVFGSPFGKKRVVRGTIPKGRNAFTIKAAMPQPEEILARDLMAQLAKEGIFVSGEVRFSKTNTRDIQVIYIHESPCLTEIVKVLNYESVNLIAEHLVRQIAFEKAGIGNREKGLEIINDFWQNKIFGTEIFFMADGSGLSHFNAISPAHFTSLLQYMYLQSEYKAAFLNSLPSAGMGTMTGFSAERFPGNTLKAKSGSMARVRCYAGFLETDTDKMLAFAILFNHFGGSSFQLTREIEKLLYELQKSN